MITCVEVLGSISAPPAEDLHRHPSARLLLGEGESSFDSKCDPVELAAYTAVAGVLLNLDETVTKE